MIRVATLVVVVDVVTAVGTVMVEIASGTRTIFVIVAVMTEVLETVLAPKISSFVFVRKIVSVTMDLMNSTQSILMGYTGGKYTPWLVFFPLIDFSLGMSRLFFLGTYPNS